MKKTFTLLALFVLAIVVKAQNPVPVYEPYGKVDKEDLELKACDFEKDANAEVLFDKGNVYFDMSLRVVMERHKRIKIFNDNGKDAANIRIEFYSNEKYEYIEGLQAETINLTDGKVEITKLDKKQVYTQDIDKYRSAIVFTMPNVKAGSIIEYKYTWDTVDQDNMPTWFFQESIPVRYSELDTNIPEYFIYSTKTNTLAPYTQNIRSNGSGNIMVDNTNVSYNSDVQKRVMVNVPSLSDEPYMTAMSDNLRNINFVLTSFRPPYGFIENYNDSWAKVGGHLHDSEDFGFQSKRKLANEEDLISKAQSLKTDDEKIAFLFNQVKTMMKWNGSDDWYTIDGTSKAWDNKTGNSTEINLILYHLLKKSGVNAFPMVVSTRKHGKVNPIYPFLYQFNRGVVYIPVDSTKSYILDATNKYGSYNEIPYNLLNSEGLYINMDKDTYDLVFLQNLTPARRSIFINADIQPGGKMDGTAQISCSSYHRISNIDRYKTDGETKFIDYLRDNDNNLKISSLKMENMDVDTLPLVQDVNFNLDLAGSDDNYIYVNPNLFTLLHKNNFLSETRTTNIDFGYLDNLVVNARYKIPAGYKVDVLPKNISMTTPDRGLLFRRTMAEDDGTIVLRYVIYYQKSIFFKEDYPDFYAFQKKMYEMLNEQIVLKKI